MGNIGSTLEKGLKKITSGGILGTDILGGARKLYEGADSVQQTSLIEPATAEQANQQYKNVQDTIAQQQAFLQAIQAQNGLQNQTNVYNQMQNIASGVGPNPAQAMLNQQTGANIANQAALMAGQRGAATNPALIARLAAQQGANLQQQAVGQGAALQANQQLAALNNMGNIAGQQAQNQLNAQNQLANTALNSQGNILQAIGNRNQAAVGNISQANQYNSGIAAANLDRQAKIAQGVASGVSSAMTGIPMGGMGGGFGGGGMMTAGGGGSAGSGGMMHRQQPINMASGGEIKSEQPMSRIAQYFNSPVKMAEGGQVPALVSPGEKYIAPEDLAKVKGGASPLTVGKTIPGVAKVQGDSYANDTVPAMLKEGGIIIPRSIVHGKDAAKKSAEFVAAILNKQHIKK
jgi:hypothetical protein